MHHLEPALKKLLEGFDTIFLYSTAVDAQHKPPAPRLVKVILLSKKATVSAAARDTEEKSVGGQLRRALIEDKRLVAKGIVDALNVSAEEEVEKTVETLIQPLYEKDFRGHYETLDVLKKLAPQKIVDTLAGWLHTNDPEMRAVAATGLGYLGDERAIEPLVSALAMSDPQTRKVVASSLARIGGDRVTTILFDAYLTGDEGLKQAVSFGIALHGDANSQNALADLISAGGGPKGKTAQEVIANSLPPDETDIGKKPAPTGGIK